MFWKENFCYPATKGKKFISTLFLPIFIINNSNDLLSTNQYHKGNSWS